MSDTPATGTFRIVGLKDPAGIISEAQPTENIHLQGAIQEWRIVQQAGFSTFQFGIGSYRFTGVNDDKLVIATGDIAQNLNWFARYIEAKGAYTIERHDSLGNGWTLRETLEANPPYVIRPIPSTGSPPQFEPEDRQLFKFVKVSD